MSIDKPSLFSEKELVRESGLAAANLEEAERYGLIRPIGVADHNIRLFDRNALQRARHLKSLLELGYAFDHIKRIASEVGLPGEDGPTLLKEGTVFLTVGELARRTGLNPRTIKYWEERGIITPEGRSEGGYRLYTIHYVLFCHLVRDLQNFGYNLEEIKEVSDLFRIFYQLKNNLRSHEPRQALERLRRMDQKIAELFKHTAILKAGIERWETLLNRKRVHVTRMRERTEHLLESQSPKEAATSPEAEVADASASPERSEQLRK